MPHAELEEAPAGGEYKPGHLRANVVCVMFYTPQHELIHSSLLSEMHSPVMSTRLQLTVVLIFNECASSFIV